MKLKVHFQDTREQANLSGEEYRFNSKNNNIGFLQSHTIRYTYS